MSLMGKAFVSYGCHTNYLIFSEQNIFFHSSEVQKSEITVSARAILLLKALRENPLLASSGDPVIPDL